jgi:zinc transport system substrate-binding protein
VNYPLAYFAGRIGGDHVTIEFPAPRDLDPAFWQPNEEAIGAYQSADLVLLNGAGYAKWLDVVTLSASRMVNTSASFSDRYLAVAGTVTHSHGPEGEHSHEGTAFTTWLDPHLAMEHAAAIAEAFSTRWPEHEEDFGAGMAALTADLQSLDSALLAATAPAGSRPLAASHPVYQYLAARYDLNLRSVQWEPDAVPSAAMWRDFQRLLREHPATIMLWEAEPMAEAKERLGALGVTTVVFDQSANVPAEGDYLTVMRHNVQSLTAALDGR